MLFDMSLEAYHSKQKDEKLRVLDLNVYHENNKISYDYKVNDIRLLDRAMLQRSDWPYQVITLYSNGDIIIIKCIYLK
jgi:hypothetical protein